MTGARRAGLAVAVLLAIAAAAGALAWRRAAVPDAASAGVTRGRLTATLIATGALKPTASTTYRSPVPGRDVEIQELVAEGSRVEAGDLLVRFDTTDLRSDLERAEQERRQAQIDFQAAAGEWEEAQAALKAVSEGEGALSVEEAQAALQRAERKRDRLKQEFDKLSPLMARGYMTREELAKTSDQLEQAEDELALARRRADVLVGLTHPREEKRAIVQLAQKESQMAHGRTRLAEADARVAGLRELIAACVVRAKGPGLVVHEELLSAVPRRKVRVGDRVFATQGVVTIPQVNRMVMEGSVTEAEVHRVRPGQRAVVRVEAFPDLRLDGTVDRVGTLASASINRPFDDKRFEIVIDLAMSPAELRPEMTARADIVVGDRADVLLAPVTAIFERQGLTVAYVAGGAGGSETRQVQIGASNDRDVEIVAGLREGERVWLTEPPGASPVAPASATPPTGAPRALADPH